MPSCLRDALAGPMEAFLCAMEDAGGGIIYCCGQRVEAFECCMHMIWMQWPRGCEVASESDEVILVRR